MGVSEKAIIANEAILEFIPQRAPIVMVNEFFGIADNISASGLTIREDNIFSESGGIFSECGVMEHIAQSAALRMGYIYKSQNKDVPLGFIGSINKFRLHSLPKTGDRLRTEITIEQEIMNISLISAVVKIGDEVIADCQMKIYLQQ